MQHRGPQVRVALLQATPEPDSTAAPERAVPLLREFVEGEWKKAHLDRYKPSTRKGVDALLARRILPEFGSKRLDCIAPARIMCWFDAYSRTAPGNANHALALLRQIMNFVIACGYIEKNPTQGIRPNRRPKLTRFLSREEIGRLHRVLDAQTGDSDRQQADVIRLLLLTGCRRGEILGLRWSEVHRDALFLSDAKMGARKVPLNSQARSILDRQPRDANPFVFPSPRNPHRPLSEHLSLWYRVRREAGIEDVRLHDLRHTFASHAVLRGIPLPVVSRLLGHAHPSMTLRYAHVSDRETEAAAERIGAVIARALDGDEISSRG